MSPNSRGLASPEEIDVERTTEVQLKDIKKAATALGVALKKKAGIPVRRVEIIGVKPLARKGLAEIASTEMDRFKDVPADKLPESLPAMRKKVLGRLRGLAAGARRPIRRRYLYGR
jgi:hypothetical protein